MQRRDDRTHAPTATRASPRAPDSGRPTRPPRIREEALRLPGDPREHLRGLRPDGCPPPRRHRGRLRAPASARAHRRRIVLALAACAGGPPSEPDAPAARSLRTLHRGRTVARLRTRAPAPTTSQWSRADSTCAAPLTSGAADDLYPSWSIDDRIAFASDRDGALGIWIHDLVTGLVAPLDDRRARGILPRLLAGRDEGRLRGARAGSLQTDFYVVAATGGTAVALAASTSKDAGPAWSPDGLTLYFVSSRTGRYELFSVAAAGGDATRLTTGSRVIGKPAVAPDGCALYYARTVSGGVHDGDRPLRAGHVGHLRSSPARTTPSRPSIPSGGRLAVRSFRSGSADLFVEDAADGAHPLALTADAASDGAPAFAPALVSRADARPMDRLPPHGALRPRLPALPPRPDPQRPRTSPLPALERILDQAIALHRVPHVGFTGGEPVLHPRLADAVDAAPPARPHLARRHERHRLRLARVEVVEASAARRQGLTLVTLSLDGATAAAHDAVRGAGSYRDVMAAALACRARDLPFAIQATLHALNAGELEAIGLEAAQLGASRVRFAHDAGDGDRTTPGSGSSRRRGAPSHDRIARLAEVLRIPVRRRRASPVAQPFHVCEPWRSEVLHVDVHGRLTLCCQLAGAAGGEEPTSSPTSRRSPSRRRTRGSSTGPRAPAGAARRGRAGRAGRVGPLPVQLVRAPARQAGTGPPAAPTDRGGAHAGRRVTGALLRAAVLASLATATGRSAGGCSRARAARRAAPAASAPSAAPPRRLLELLGATTRWGARSPSRQPGWSTRSGAPARAASTARSPATRRCVAQGRRSPSSSACGGRGRAPGPRVAGAGRRPARRAGGPPRPLRGRVRPPRPARPEPAAEEAPVGALVPDPDVILTELRDGTGVLLHLGTKFYYALNATGVVTWKRLAAGGAAGAEEMVRAIAQRLLGRRSRVARRDVEALLRELAAEGLLAPAGGAAP